MIKYFLRARTILIVLAAILLSVIAVKAATNIGDNIFTDGSINGNFLGTWDGYATNTLPYLSSSDLSSASSTQIKSFWATPSTRVAAGTNLSWSGNTLNASTGGSSQWTTSGNDIYNNNSGAVSIGGSSTSTAAFFINQAKRLAYFAGATDIYEMGDSLTSGLYGLPYSDYLQTLLGSSYKANGNHNKGVGGNTTSQMLARFNSILINTNINYVIIWGGINDISGSTASSTIEANLQSMYTMAHNVGAKVVSINIAPRDTSTAAQKKEIIDVNAWIANVATNIDYKIDAYSEFNDPGNTGNLKAIYSYGDGTHFNQTGYNEIAMLIYNGVTWTKNSSSYLLGLSGNSYLDQDLSSAATPNFSGINILRDNSYKINGVPMITASTSLYNYFLGYHAGNLTMTGGYNYAFGVNALYSNTTGYNNVGMGYQSFFSNTTGYNNVGIGYQSLLSNTGGYNNVGIGYESLYSNTTSNGNVAVGYKALHTNTTGNNNVANGFYSLYNNSTGSGNLAIGFRAGTYETGSNAFYVNNIDQTNTANDKVYSLLYGQFSGTAGSLTGQLLTVNGQFNVNGNVAIGTTTAPNLLSVKAQTGTSTIEVGTNAKTASCLKFEDTDKAGWTYCVFLNGTMTCSQNDCSN
jgi:lysophospholipase L1-like esterase